MAEFPHIFISVDTRAKFEQALEDGRVSQYQIAFIEDTHEIWARGKYYPCPYTKTEIDKIIKDLQDSKVDVETYNAAIERLESALGELPVADEEDITVTADSKLQLKDRDSSKGMGYKILRLPEDGILTQEMISEPNTIYEIRYGFDLNGQTITIPENCVLKFEGGKLENGSICGNSTGIVASRTLVFSSIIVEGEWRVPVIYSEWFETSLENNLDSFKNLVALTSDEVYNTIQIKGINYKVSVDSIPFKLKSNTHINFSGANVQVISNNLRDSQLIWLDNVENIEISNGTLIGDCRTHTASSEESTDEWNQLIKINGCRNITIHQMTINESTGDGIDLLEKDVDGELYVPTNIQISGCILDNNGRNNISIEAGNNITITNCTLSNASQISQGMPGNGIDVEPWQEGIDVSSIYIKDCVFKNNYGQSIQLCCNQFEQVNDRDNNILISNCKVNGILIVSTNGVVLENLRAFDPSKYNILVIGTGNSNNIVLRNSDFMRFQCNKDARLVNSYISNINEIDSTGKLENITFENAIIDSDNLLVLSNLSESDKLNFFRSTFHKWYTVNAGGSTISFDYCNFECPDIKVSNVSSNSHIKFSKLHNVGNINLRFPNILNSDIDCSGLILSSLENLDTVVRNCNIRTGYGITNYNPDSYTTFVVLDDNNYDLESIKISSLNSYITNTYNNLKFSGSVSRYVDISAINQSIEGSTVRDADGNVIVYYNSKWINYIAEAISWEIIR